MKYLILIALLIPPLAHADKLYLGAKSYHFDRSKDYNESHQLVMYERGGIIGGYFKNSYHEDTFLLAKRYYHDFSSSITGSLLLGLTYGYRDLTKPGDLENPRKLLPLVTVGIEYRFSFGGLVNSIFMGSAIATLPGVEW